MIKVDLLPDKGVTDSGFVRIARAVAQHLAQPEIRQFPPDQEVHALAWLETGK